MKENRQLLLVVKIVIDLFLSFEIDNSGFSKDLIFRVPRTKLKANAKQENTEDRSHDIPNWACVVFPVLTPRIEWH